MKILSELKNVQEIDIYKVSTLTYALELSLEGFLLTAVGNVEEKVGVLGLQELRWRNGSADAQNASWPLGAGLSSRQDAFCCHRCSKSLK